MKNLLLFLALGIGFTSLSQNEGQKIKRSDITNCLLIEKEFINKGGDATGDMELYLRCSMDDYFIKLCESNVTRKELEKYLDRGIAVTMDIKEGEWDNCSDGEYPVQSRVGKYVVISSILK